MRKKWLVTALAVATAAALAGCAPTPPAGSGGPSDLPAGTTSSTPSATATAAPAVTIPTDCTKIITPATYAKSFASTPLNDPAVVEKGQSGVVNPVTPPANATPKQVLDSAVQLRCMWRDPGADVTYLEATVATVNPATANSYLSSLTSQGYTCAAANGGQQCQLVRKHSQYPVDEAFTYLLRGSVLVHVSQANFPTQNLMGEIAAAIWA